MLRLIAIALLLLSACSTAGTFRLPEQTTLTIAGRQAKPVDGHPGMLQTSTFGWGSSQPFELRDQSGNVVRRGELRTKFRPAAVIFWPLLFRPYGLVKGGRVYDLTAPADGSMVLRDVPTP